MKAVYLKVNGEWRKAVYVWKKIGGFWVPQFPWFNNITNWRDCWEAPAVAPDTVFIVDSGSFAVTGAGMVAESGTVGFSDASATISMDLIIKVRVIHYITGVVADVEYYNNSYTANASIGSMSQVVFGPPIPDTGYIVRLEFNEAS